VPEKPQIAVVVPSHRSEETIGACLDALLGQTLPPAMFEIHVVDSGEDRTEAVVAERAENWDGRLLYHRSPELGPGRQRNFGVEHADAPYLAFTDSDCVPDPHWLEAGLAHLDAGAAIVQGPTQTPDGNSPPPFAHAIVTNGPSPLFESCNVMYEADAFRGAGGFSVDLFEQAGSHMGEDTELAWRVRRLGGQAVYEPRALVRHRVFAPDYARYLRYQWQARFFPRLVSRVPELRAEILIAGLFLGRRSTRSCGALAGLLLGRRRRWAYVLALPYALHLGRKAVQAPSPRVAAAELTKHVVADSIREGALIWGSARHRSLIL
jgi:glycosyltransferase involved in cell wall biosynthesis